MLEGMKLAAATLRGVDRYDAWFDIIAPLLPFIPLINPQSPLGTFMPEYCVLLATLCRFHAFKTLSQEVKSTSHGIPRDLQQEVISSLKAVLDAPNWMEEKRLWQAFVTWFNGIAEAKDAASIGAYGDPVHYRKSFIQYLLENWLCKRWHCTIAMRVRNAVSHFCINSGNHAELFFNNPAELYSRLRHAKYRSHIDRYLRKA